MAELFRNRALRAVTPMILLLLAWSLASTLGWLNAFIFPPPWIVLSALLNPENRSDLLLGLVATGRRFLLGAAIGILLGNGFGALLALTPRADRLMGPSFHAFRQIAIFAWIPLLSAWFGNGDMAKIVFIALAAFKPGVMGSYEGIRGVSRNYLEVGRVLCFARWRMLARIIIPAALPAIIAGVQLSLVFGWLGAVGAEYLMGGAARGIGSFVMAGSEQVRPDIMILGIVVIAAAGVIINNIFRSTRRLLPERNPA